MDASAALLAGLAAGLAIAMQVGAVSLLLVEAAVVSGPRVGVAAGMGVAAADLGFAAVAAAAGGAAGAALSSHETEIRVIAAIVIAAIAVHGLIALARERDGAEREREADGGSEAGAAADDAPDADGASQAGASAGVAREADAAPPDAAADLAREADAAPPDAAADLAPEADAASAPRDPAPRAHFARFLAITAANPLTIASFAAVAAALSLDGPAAAAAFAAGVGLASAAWHLLLSLAAGHAGRWMTPRARRAFAVAGRLGVLAIAAHLALA